MEEASGPKNHGMSLYLYQCTRTCLGTPDIKCSELIVKGKCTTKSIILPSTTDIPSSTQHSTHPGEQRSLSLCSTRVSYSCLALTPCFISYYHRQHRRTRELPVSPPTITGPCPPTLSAICRQPRRMYPTCLTSPEMNRYCCPSPGLLVCLLPHMICIPLSQPISEWNLTIQS